MAMPRHASSSKRQHFDVSLGRSGNASYGSDLFPHLNLSHRNDVLGFFLLPRRHVVREMGGGRIRSQAKDVPAPDD